MSFRKFLFLGVALALGCASAAKAQLGVYGVVTGERVGGFTCQDPQNRCASNDGKERPYGGNFGVFYDFRTYGPARIGVDLRGGVTNASKSAVSYGTSSDGIRHYSGLGGLRASFKTRYSALHPYGEVLGGYARYQDGGRSQFTQVQGLVGLDVKILPLLDFRAIEFGMGEMFGGTNNHMTESIGAGIVLHLP